MLEHTHIAQYSRPLDVFTADSGFIDGLVFNPPYQRGSVWTDEQRRNLIKSLLEGLPIGAIFLNHRDIFTTVIVDGKQRIETIQAFARGGFPIPGDWVGEPGLACFYDNLTPQKKRWVGNAIIATYETQLPGEQQERDLYNRINFGGTPHEEGDRA